MSLYYAIFDISKNGGKYIETKKKWVMYSRMNHQLCGECEPRYFKSRKEAIAETSKLARPEDIIRIITFIDKDKDKT